VLTDLVTLRAPCWLRDFELPYLNRRATSLIKAACLQRKHIHGGAAPMARPYIEHIVILSLVIEATDFESGWFGQARKRAGRAHALRRQPELPSRT